MLAFEQDNKIYVFTSLHENLCFAKLVSDLHVYIELPINTVILAISKGAGIHGLCVVENFEVLFHHTPVVNFRLVMDDDHPDYQKTERTVRFIRSIYGFEINIVRGTKLSV